MSDEHTFLKIGRMYASDHSGGKISASRKILNIDASGEDRKEGSTSDGGMAGQDAVPQFDRYVRSTSSRQNVEILSQVCRKLVT